ncbi:NAD-dependent epimerase/dehydratase family protein [Paracoccus alkanivorans]|uniref:NAD-dependent epimerase/dehydratase family protein n=1 Tax=Paracoccus alkanivorans TaxID=2116655 RepID=UPI001408B507|nr:NAD-dependent epimerase/dehydratase family protein [Paracoccus alkanivorans]
MKNILVIGGSGFVGGALIPTLIRAGHAVTILNRGNRKIDGVSQIVADRDRSEEMAKHSASFDVVVDTSGYTRQQVETAFSAFGNFASKWIHLSSAAVYRETPDRLPAEDDSLGGAEIWGAYGLDKSRADEFLVEHVECPLAILRPPYLYGPNNANDRETFIWSRVLTGRPIIIPGDGSVQFQFLHVQDLANIITHFVDADFGKRAIYNVAEPETMNAEAWVKKVAAVSGGELKIVSGKDHASDVMARRYFPFRDYSCALDVSKLLRDFNWAFEFSFDDGIRNTISNYDIEALRQVSPSSPDEIRILRNT